MKTGLLLGATLVKRIILPILITAGIVLLLLLQISLRDLYTLLRTIDPLWLALGSFAYLLANLLRAIRFRWLIHSKDIPFPDLFRITSFYHLSLMVLPSKLGELSYPYLLNKMSGRNVTEGLASLVVSRVYDFFIILLILLFVFIRYQTLFRVNPFFLIPVVIFLILLMILVFFYIGRLLKWFSNILGKIFNRPGRNASFVSWIRQKMDEMAEDSDSIKARKTYFPVTLTSVASWVMIFSVFYAYMKGFGVEVSSTRLILGSTIAVIGNALPVSGIGNWGTLEAGWAAGFLMVGLSKEKAITTGFGIHILIFIVCAVISFFCWVTSRKQKNPSPDASS